MERSSPRSSGSTPSRVSARRRVCMFNADPAQRVRHSHCAVKVRRGMSPDFTLEPEPCCGSNDKVLTLHESASDGMDLARHAARSSSMSAIQECAVKSILDPTFRYTKSVDTDLKKTFARIRRALRKQSEGQSNAEPEGVTKVVQIRRQQH